MKTHTLSTNAIRPISITVKADIAIKVLLFAAILTGINLVAFM